MILERFSKKLFGNLQRSLQVPERYSMQFCQLTKFSRKSSLNYQQLVTSFFVNRWATVSGLEMQSVTSATLTHADMTMVTIGEAPTIVKDIFSRANVPLITDWHLQSRECSQL